MPEPPKQPTNFIDILEQVWWRLDVALDEEMIRWSAKLGAVEALMSGTTGILDHHESPSAIDGSLSIMPRNRSVRCSASVWASITSIAGSGWIA